MTGTTEFRAVPLAKQPNIRDTVKEALRSAIISGEMRPGTVYSAPNLAKQFGVSATPIREAMLELARQGLVSVMPNRGFRVTEVSRQDLVEVTELRLMIEPPAVERATPLIPADALRELRQQCDQLVAYADAGDLVDYLTADSEFHLALMRHGGNRRLLDIVASLRSETRLFGLSRLSEEGLLPASAREHVKILDAVEAGDGAQARDLIHAHIEHVLTDWSDPDRASQSSEG
ncbi:GntR family transcriptional regulator [Microbacterium halophytorum]|uniref:GntR family transcriptional regulator n=1 Tax=Microbacterium halophytorum TaxID=2067568 RepID=UPI000CFCF2E8|nr:GntR family transcriptional regulator [Microbacterium halophytorum]